MLHSVMSYPIISYMHYIILYYIMLKRESFTILLRNACSLLTSVHVKCNACPRLGTTHEAQELRLVLRAVERALGPRGPQHSKAFVSSNQYIRALSIHDMKLYMIHPMSIYVIHLYLHIDTLSKEYLQKKHLPNCFMRPRLLPGLLQRL